MHLISYRITNLSRSYPLFVDILLLQSFLQSSGLRLNDAIGPFTLDNITSSI